MGKRDLLKDSMKGGLNRSQYDNMLHKLKIEN